MISTEAMRAVAVEDGARDRQAVFAQDRDHRGARPISRLILALVLAAISVLIPGEAGRFVGAQLEWSELVRVHSMMLPRMSR
jgi:hypothetical protein